MGDIKRKATFEKLFREAVPNSEGKIWFQHPSKMYSERKICFMLDGKEEKFLMYMSKEAIEKWKQHFIEFVDTGEFDMNYYCQIYGDKLPQHVTSAVHKFPFTENYSYKFATHHPRAMKLLRETKYAFGDCGMMTVGKPARPRYTLVCINCGSDNVQSKAWVNANTNEYVCDCSDGSSEDFWCEDCKGHHTLTSTMKP